MFTFALEARRLPIFANSSQKFWRGKISSGVYGEYYKEIVIILMFISC